MTTSPRPPSSGKSRPPKVFSVNDPALRPSPASDVDHDAVFARSRSDPKGDRIEPPAGSATGSSAGARAISISGSVERGFRWGAVLLSAATALIGIALSLWFANFVSDALARNDWIGWLATALITVIAVALVAIIIRELAGLARLSRLTALRQSVSKALAAPSPDAERAAVSALARHYRGRTDVAWGLRRLEALEGDVLDPGERLRLADRELLRPLDDHARQLILRAAKRVATVTTLSPVTAVSLAFVLAEAVSMFRKLATLYGGRPGTIGALKLSRLVVGHMVATGGIALTDDLFGQFLGQDLLRRLSRRLGEGAFNGALTARLGIAAVDVLRPIPPIDGDPIRVREIFAELFRSLRGQAAGQERGGADREGPTTDRR